MRLAYEAYDRGGRLVTGSIDAASTREATERLYADGLYVTRLSGASDEAAPEQGSGLLAGRCGGLKQLVVITRQLSVLASTGTQVVEALAAVERQIPPGSWRRVLGDVRRDVEEGKSLTEALAKHPRHFDPIYRSLIAAGESGGQLPAMLERLAVIKRKQLKIRSAVLGALSYPILLTCLSIVVVVVMLLAVLPRFAGLFEALDAPLPRTTRALISLSESIKTYWWAVTPALLGIVGGAVWFVRSAPGRRWIDNVSISLPVLGPFVKALVTARVARTLGVLLEAKVPLLESLALTRAAAGNTRYVQLLESAEERVTRGEPISAALRDSPLIAPGVTEAVITGERAGRVGEVLISVADYMDEDNEVVIRSMMSLLEPVILVALGGAVGFVAMSLFLPLFDLTSAAGGQ